MRRVSGSFIFSSILFPWGILPLGGRRGEIRRAVVLRLAFPLLLMGKRRFYSLLRARNYFSFIKRSQNVVFNYFCVHKSSKKNRRGCVQVIQIFTYFTFEKKLARFAHSDIFSHPIDRFVCLIFHTLHAKRRN